MDLLFLLCTVKADGTKIPPCARTCSWVQSSYSVLHPLSPLCRVGMQSPVCRVWLWVPTRVCLHWGAWTVSISPFCGGRSTLSQSLNPHCTENCSPGVQQESQSLSCSLAQGICKYLVGNAQGQPTGTGQGQSAQERGAGGRAVLCLEQQKGLGPGQDGKRKVRNGFPHGPYEDLAYAGKQTFG